MSKIGFSLEDHHKKIITNELSFVLQKYGSDLEEVKYSDRFAAVTALIPLKVSLNSLFNEIIEECNQFGDFLHSNVIVTNVKVLSFDEIRDYLSREEDAYKSGEEK
jgi:hypothetical protein